MTFPSPPRGLTGGAGCAIRARCGDAAVPSSASRERAGQMSINKTRGFLYWLARLLGDINAVKRGKVGRRVARRAAGRMTGRTLRKLFK